MNGELWHERSSDGKVRKVTVFGDAVDLDRIDVLSSLISAGHVGLLRYSPILPLRPIWPGFALNTIFYAAALWLLTCGPFALRRLVRIRRGLCPACAYPLGESAICSECGKPLAKCAVV
ncbi:MAG: hypothetical protein ACYS1B_05355 [Planctomycetota bacterium]|jgi:hypothetical protein